MVVRINEYLLFYDEKGKGSGVREMAEKDTYAVGIADSVTRTL